MRSKVTNNRRSQLIKVLVVIAILNFQSCREDGPLEPLRSKQKRISKKWDLEKIDGEFPIIEQYQGWSNDIEVIDFDVTFDFEEDGDFEMNAYYTLEIQSYYYGYYGGGGSRTWEMEVTASADGEWEFSSDKDEVELDFDSFGWGYGYGGRQKDRDYKVLRLKSDELVLEAEDGSEWYFKD